jgi:tRNA-specific 2-thiouridylase
VINKQTVYVGMSGGVDSSVTAALIKEQGYNVVGVYMKNWTRDVGGFTCPWRADLTDAQSVAAGLNIPFKIFDFEKEYKQKVVDYMVREYKSGLTPNPDIMCNQEIKFKLFLETALGQGADKIATGHYSRIVNNSASTKLENLNTKQNLNYKSQTSKKQADLQGSTLQKGLDESKDQSYFLYRITPEVLAKTMMPLGDLTKKEVRAIAKKLKLATANKPDSQGICFVGEVGIKDFLKDYIKTQPGPIKTLDGTEIGQHDGAVFYTIGQRQGLGVGGGLPYYVVEKDMKHNIVYVTNDLANDKLWSNEFSLSKPHWINEPPKPDTQYQLKLRYRSKSVPGTLQKLGDKYHVMLKEADRAVTPGQSAVVYSGETVLGGGIITLV